MRTAKRGLLLFVMSLLLTVMVGCDNGSSSSSSGSSGPTVAVESVKVTASSTSIAMGDTVDLSVEFTPPNATNKNVTYASSNESVLQVNSVTGAVTVMGSGTATITITSQDGAKVASVTIVVSSNSVAPTSITLVPADKSIQVGESYDLVETVSPGSATYAGITYSVVPAGIVEISESGRVTGKSGGNATITATIDGTSINNTARVTVTDAPISPTGLVVTPDNNTLLSGDSYELDVTILPVGADTSEITYSVSPSGVVNVVDGVVTAIGGGSATITVSLVDYPAVSTTVDVNVVETAPAQGYDDSSGVWHIYNEAGLAAYQKATVSNSSLPALLISDITLTAPETDNTSNWTPINNFSGIFDGNNKTISGVVVHSTSNNQGFFGQITGTVKNLVLDNISITGQEDVGGAVGYLQESGLVENVSVVGDSNISGERWTGGIVGRNEGGIIHCYNEASIVVSTGSVAAGGITGGSSGNEGIIIASHNAGNVTGTSSNMRIGGIVGRNDSLVIASYNTGNLSVIGDDSYIGGIAGRNSEGNNIIASYSTGILSGTGTNNYTGGIVGNNGTSYNGATVGAVINTYFLTGTAPNGIGNPASDDEATPVADIAGLNAQAVLNDMNNAIDAYNSTEAVKIRYKFVDGGANSPMLEKTVVEVSAIIISADVQYITTSETAQLTTVYLPVDATGGDSFIIDWTSSNNSIATVNNGIVSPVSNGDVTITAKVRGTNVEKSIVIRVEDEGFTLNSNNVYEISNARGLFAFSEAVANDNTIDAVLVDNITFIPQVDVKVSNWISISSYRGTFDGDNKAVSGIVVYEPERSQQGFFGTVDRSGTVQNLVLDNISVTGINAIGGVVGFLTDSGLVENVSVIGNSNITGIEFVGGIAGQTRTKIVNAYNEADIIASGYDDGSGDIATAGGITGGSFTGTGEIIASHNVGNVTGTEDNMHLGGIVGGNISLVIASYNTGTVSAKGSNSFVGGIVGRNNNGYNIIASYSTGTVSGMGNNNFIGGVVGNNDADNNGATAGIVTSTYFLTGTATNGIGNPASDIEATPIADIAGLNNIVDAMNTAIQTYVGANGEVWFRWHKGTDTATDLPTVQGQQ